MSDIEKDKQEQQPEENVSEPAPGVRIRAKGKVKMDEGSEIIGGTRERHSHGVAPVTIPSSAAGVDIEAGSDFISKGKITGGNDIQEVDQVGKDTSSATEAALEQIPKAKPVTKILFLAANPVNSEPLRLDQEISVIDNALRLAQFRERFDIRQHWAVQVSEIEELLLRHRPEVVHFSGHGSPRSEIILEDAQGQGQIVPSIALSQLFSVLKDNIRCVVLNACYSENQARAIAQHIDCVIGMSKAVGDQVAIRFAAAFYQAVGYGRDIQTAFDLGCLEIHLEKMAEQDTPKLIAERVDPRTVFLVHPDP